jgi:hypothetical protein
VSPLIDHLFCIVFGVAEKNWILVIFISVTDAVFPWHSYLRRQFDICSPLRFMIAGSRAWQSFAHWIAH